MNNIIDVNCDICLAVDDELIICNVCDDLVCKSCIFGGVCIICDEHDDEEDLTTGDN